MIRRKSSDIKLGFVAALALKNDTSTNDSVLKPEAVSGIVGGRRFSVMDTPISEEEARRVRRGSVLAVRAYEEQAV